MHIRILALLFFLSATAAHCADLTPGQGKSDGFPAEVLARQHFDRAPLPSIDEAIAKAMVAARAAAMPLIDAAFHDRGRRLLVPAEYPSIQQALDTADAGDTVVVRPGTYSEHLFIRDGIKLVSDAGPDNDAEVLVEGARLTLPQRALITIIDGSYDNASPVGMLNFSQGAGRHTIVDGFTIRNMPRQNHHLPAHTHAVNLRGASPVIMNCYVRDNGSTGIGNHVAYLDQNAPMAERDFRQANIETPAAAVVFHNIVRNNFGRGIGCNHFATTLLAGNEVMANDDSGLEEKAGPGIGIKHGARPTVVGNVVHDNPYGGIKIKFGEPQGKFDVDRQPSAEVRANVLFQNGDQPNLTCAGCGVDSQPAIITGNYLFESAVAGISLVNKTNAIVEENIVSGCRNSGIVVNDSHLVRLNRNLIANAKNNGLMVSKSSTVDEMIDNTAFAIEGQAFLQK